MRVASAQHHESDSRVMPAKLTLQRDPSTPQRQHKRPTGHVFSNNAWAHSFPMRPSTSSSVTALPGSRGVRCREAAQSDSSSKSSTVDLGAAIRLGRRTAPSTLSDAPTQILACLGFPVQPTWYPPSLQGAHSPRQASATRQTSWNRVRALLDPGAHPILTRAPVRAPSTPCVDWKVRVPCLMCVHLHTPARWSTP